jgi:hypothetical protein
MEGRAPADFFLKKVGRFINMLDMQVGIIILSSNKLVMHRA